MHEPGGDLRPVLIIAVNQSKDKVLCVYGSSAAAGSVAPPPLEEWQIEINPSKTSGLSFITRFDLMRTAHLPWTEKWFPSYRGTIGYLTASEKASAVLAKECAKRIFNENPDIQRCVRVDFEPKEKFITEIHRVGSRLNKNEKWKLNHLDEGLQE